jgi:acyl transferase domain-containing protein/acyl carrier protein
MQSSSDVSGTEIAVVGMAGRFPGASGVEALWEVLRKGEEKVARIDLEDWARETRVHRALLERPDMVPMRPSLEGVELFDAGFFGYTPREAQVLDPQQRVFLECCWEALENAGYDVERFEGSIGVAAGASLSSYLMSYVQWDRELGASMGALNMGLANVSDSLATRVAYKLNLRGAAYSVQSFCSTSLVAVHLGCQSLLNHESDMALAGGVTITVPQNVGYLYQEGGILSPDGHTRTFDARGQGMVFGNGCGAVVLKRLADALRDGDNIRAVLLGSAINNDGSVKVGFTAPSVGGQAEVIVEALSAAGINPETISYVEAHGTATALGDPAEVAGLTKAWRKWTDKKRFCAIGSVKTNVGHLDAAAGVTGLIKTVLSLEHKQLPASLHFERPNPQIDFENSPFYVQTGLSEWKSEGPRRAGLSCFGIGGTNSHAILQEAPERPATDAAKPGQLLVLSAKTASALDLATRNLADHLAAHPDVNLADVAWTLQAGRKVFNHRRIVVGQDASDARAALGDAARFESVAQDRQTAPVAFLFTGQGSQYVAMGQGLYESEPVFREALDTCARLLEPHLGLDLRSVMFGADGDAEAAAGRLRQTQLTQPALFAVEYAVARLWMAWGLEPAAMLGHSVGEYVAAHLAGVMSLEDALALVAERGRLMQSVPPGAMLAVPLAESALKPYLVPGIDLASVNAPSACVVAGPSEAIAAFEKALGERGVAARALHTSHAFHSAMMDPVLDAFRARVAAVPLTAPRLRFVSNVTGTWITDAQATDPEYWVRHLRGTVRFSEGVKTLLAEDSQPVLLEVGPGSTLTSLARQHVTGTLVPVAVPSLRQPRETQPDRAFLLRALGRLWLSGVAIDWARVHAGETRRRVALPTYPFERQRHWIEANRERQQVDRMIEGSSPERRELQDWFYQPSWRSFLPSELVQPLAFPKTASWLIFADASGLAGALQQALETAGQSVSVARIGSRFEALAANQYQLDPADRAGYVSLLRSLAERGQKPDFVLHLWGVTEADPRTSLERVDEAQARGFYSLLHLAQAVARAELKKPVHWAVVTNRMQEVTGGELTCPEKATVLGPCRVVPQELTNVTCRNLDIEVPEAGSPDEALLVRRLLGELLTGQPDGIVAYRGRQRWVLSAEPMSLPPAGAASPLREKGVYLITGGMGGIGLVFARHLAERHKARLALTGRGELPPPGEWDAWLEGHPANDATSLRIRGVRDLEQRGAEVLYVGADATRLEDMQRVVALTRERFGPIHGVVHAAGVAGGGLIQLKEPEVAARVLAPKVQGTLVLDRALAGETPDFLLLCSSVAAMVGGVGQIDYCGANVFMDAFAHQRRPAGSPVVMSVNWDAWREVGMAVNTAVPGALQAARDFSLKVGISPQEGVDVFERLLVAGLPQLAVFTMDARPALYQSTHRKAQAPTPGEVKEAAAGEALTFTGEVGSAGDMERLVAETWQKILGRTQIGSNDNFFELGGDSLTALQVIQLLKARLGREVPIVTFYEAPTVGLLAKALGDGGGGGEKPAAVVLDDVEQRAGTRRDLMQRRRQQREAQPTPVDTTR